MYIATIIIIIIIIIIVIIIFLEEKTKATRNIYNTKNKLKNKVKRISFN